MVDLLSEDSSNIVELIREAYEVSFISFFPKFKGTKYYNYIMDIFITLNSFSLFISSKSPPSPP